MGNEPNVDALLSNTITAAELAVADAKAAREFSRKLLVFMIENAPGSPEVAVTALLMTVAVIVATVSDTDHEVADKIDCFTIVLEDQAEAAWRLKMTLPAASA